MTEGTPDRRRHAGRRDVRLTYVNALLWALGNGLVSTTLVVYLALEMNAGGTVIAWLYAAPKFAGVLRVAAPALMRAASRVGIGRKGVCVIAFGLSAATLVAVPVSVAGVTEASSSGEQTFRLVVLAAAWCVYHLLEYIAGVALWSWLGDLYPVHLRSQLIGHRERWLTIGRAIGIGASILLATCWRLAFEDLPSWAPLAASASVGALLMLAALVPLIMLNGCEQRASAAPINPWRTIRQAWSEKPYRRLLAYSAWLGFANGIPAAAQGMYPGRVLGVGYELLQSYRAGMWLGQSAIAPWCGRAVERFGARRLMAPMQLVAAFGSLCFWLASPEQTWWVGVAFASWIAWAGVNVGLDSLKLNLADAENNAPYLAVFHAASHLTNAVSVLFGGMLYDLLAAGDDRALRVYAALFLVGWVLKTVSVGLIGRLVEPDSAG